MKKMKHCLRGIALVMASFLVLPAVGSAEKGVGQGAESAKGEEAKNKANEKSSPQKGDAAVIEKRKDQDSGKKPDAPNPGMAKERPKGEVLAPGKSEEKGEGLALGKGHEKGKGLALGKGHEKGEGLALGKPRKQAEGGTDEEANADPAADEESAKRAAKRAEHLERIKARRLELGKNMQHKKAFEDGEKKESKPAKERRKHLNRMAAIDRILAIAAEKQDTALEERAKALQKKELERHDKAMNSQKEKNK